MQETKRNRGYGRALLEAIEDIARCTCMLFPNAVGPRHQPHMHENGMWQSKGRRARCACEFQTTSSDDHALSCSNLTEGVRCSGAAILWSVGWYAQRLFVCNIRGYA